MVGVLSGLRIIEASAFIAAPMAGLVLAQLGADVVRFDNTGGGIDYTRWPLSPSGRSLYWTGLNKNKKSIGLDLKSPEAREIIRELISDAGIFITNLPERDWLGYESLSQSRKDLIMVVVQGNPDGSKAVDYTVNCATGLPYATGPEDHDGPVNHVLPAWDIATALYVALAVAAAEMHRRETGEGRLVRVALSDVAFSTVGSIGLLSEAEVLGQDRARLGNHLYGAFGRDFSSADGRSFIVVAITSRQWRGLCDATGLANEFARIAAERGLDFTREADRFAARGEIAAAIESWSSRLPMEKIAAKLDAAGVCWGPYRRLTEALKEDPRLSLQNPMFAEIDQPGIGVHRAPGSPLDFAGAPRTPPSVAPNLGADTLSLLRERLGMSGPEIEDLIARGIVTAG
ncbi:MAG: CoA transferase [Sphingomonadales bacterium]|nr:CoA transferase [Sphingomonadales bacterium]